MSEPLQASLRYLRGGLSVIPIKADGSKRPALPEWERFHRARASEEVVRSWHAASDAGVGIVTDEASGFLAVLDFEFLDFFEQWSQTLELECPGMLSRLPVVQTPGKDEQGGRHVYLRCPEVYSGRKLARISKEEAERRTGDRGKTTAIELKGKGGQVLAPGCPPECHPSGRLYRFLGGPPIEETPQLSAEEVALLLRLARSLDKTTAAHRNGKDSPPRQPAPVQSSQPTQEGEKPGEEFSRKARWADILEPHGWAFSHSVGAVQHWTRPGKEKGTSGTIGHCTGSKGGDLLYVFSTSAEPLEHEKTYSKFGAYAVLNFGGDHSAAARELARSGYGTPPEEVDLGKPDPAEDEATPEPETPDWPVGVFPRPVEQYIEALARSLGCPIDLPGAVILSVAGSAIGASRALAVTRTWTESARFYLALVADPGGGKSPVVDQITAPLIDAQTNAHADWEVKKAEYDARIEVFEQEKKVHAKRVAEAKNEEQKRQAGEPPTPPVRPPYPHCYTSDATTEALVPMLVENPRGFLMLKDELSGWISSMNQYRSGGKGSDRQFWLSAWSGASIKTDRKSNRDRGPLIVSKPFVSVLGGIQPDMLSSLSDERGREDGFVHRLLFVYPTDMPWPEHICESPAEGLEIVWRSVVTYLFDLHLTVDEEGEPVGPVIVQMTAEAREAAAGWYAAHARERSSDDFPAHLVGPWSKMRAHFFRLALVVHFIRLACGETCGESVDIDSILRAMQLADYFKGQLRKVYARLGCTKEDGKAIQLVEWIRKKGGRVTVRDLLSGRVAKKSTEAAEALKDLVDRGFGTLEEQPKVPGPGRSKPSVFVLADRIVLNCAE